MDSLPLRRSPVHFSSLLKLSGMGSFWSGLSLSTLRSLFIPASVAKSFGSRCLTTDFAAPSSFCQIRGAASFRSESLRLASYHLHEVAKLSNPLGSPLHVGISSGMAVKERHQLLRLP